MNRYELREQMFKMLFRTEFHEKEELGEQLSFFFDELDQKEEADVDYLDGKFRDIAKHLPQIDEMINETAKGWKTSRMGKVDLTLIRLAVYEMKFEEDIPTGVAINEAVELAKRYGTDDSAAFVNEILAKLV